MKRLPILSISLRVGFSAAAILTLLSCSTVANLEKDSPADQFTFEMLEDGDEIVEGGFLFLTNDSQVAKASTERAFADAVEKHCGGEFIVIADSLCNASLTRGSTGTPVCVARVIRCSAGTQ